MLPRTLAIGFALLVFAASSNSGRQDAKVQSWFTQLSCLRGHALFCSFLLLLVLLGSITSCSLSIIQCASQIRKVKTKTVLVGLCDPDKASFTSCHQRTVSKCEVQKSTEHMILLDDLITYKMITTGPGQGITTPCINISFQKSLKFDIQ